MRTIIDLTAEQLAGLERFRTRRRISRAAAVRQAVDQLIARDAGDGLDDVFGVISKEEADRMRAAIAELRLEWGED